MDNEYICDDREIETPSYLKDMTEKEIEEEFKKRFGEYLIANN